MPKMLRCPPYCDGCNRNAPQVTTIDRTCSLALSETSFSFTDANAGPQRVSFDPRIGQVVPMNPAALVFSGISILPLGCELIYPPCCLRRQSFLHPFQGQRAGRAWLGRLRAPKTTICTISKRFHGHLSLNSPPSSRLVSPGCRAYPAGSGKARIRRSMLANRRRVRWLSANNSQ